MITWTDLTHCKSEWAIFTRLISLTGPSETTNLLFMHCNTVIKNQQGGFEALVPVVIKNQC